VAIRSVRDVLKPDVMFFYYFVEPRGLWWERAKPMVVLERVAWFSDYHGHRVRHPAHRSDIIRLEKILERGGVYHDLDLITLRPYEASWYNKSFVMALESEFALCNAVIMAAPNSSFGTQWLNQYKTSFDDTYWNKFSVLLPKELAVKLPNEIHVLPTSAFYVPSLLEADLNLMHSDKVEWDWRAHPEQYACVAHRCSQGLTRAQIPCVDHVGHAEPTRPLP